MAFISIHMMGGVWLEVDGKVHDSLLRRSRRGVSLMQYLILERGRVVSPQRLIRELWSGRRLDGPENALKTMVSRLRTLLNEVHEGLGQAIGFEQGGYCWKSLPDVHVDVLELMDIFEKLKHGKNGPETLTLLSRMQSLYTADLYLTGDMLNGQAALSHLHREYIEAVLRCINVLKKAERYNQICDICQKALVIDEVDEQLRIELMQAMVNLNRTGDAEAEYRKLVRAQRVQLDAEPSEDLVAKYRTLAEEGKQIVFNLDVIRNALSQQDADSKGPFFCDYRAFKEIYNIQMRNLERLGSTMFLGIIMIGDADASHMDDIRQDNVMSGLIDILRDNLRKGDIITHFAPTIVALLLPTVNYDTGTMVLERIRQLFYKRYPNSDIPFHHRLGMLGSNIQEEIEPTDPLEAGP